MAIVEYTGKAGIKTSRTQRESEIVKDFHSLITSSDSIDPSIFEDMRDYNIRGNTENKLYNVYFESMAKVIEGMGVSAEARRHASSSEIEAQGGMSYIPFATSVRELMQKTDEYLETRSIQCPRPSNSWVGFQFSPVDATRRTAERYTGLLKVVRVLSKKQAASFHQHAHWCAKNAKNWKIEAVALRKAIIEASDTNIVIPSYPYGGLVACGQDDKSSIGVGRDIAVQATSKQSTSSIMPVGTSLLACDHDYVVEKVVASVLHWMNVGESENESMYSGGENGHGRTQVPLHDATLEKSTGFKHMAHLFQAINERSKQNCVECEGDDDNWTDYIPYVVMNETDGGPDHNIQFLSNKLACVAFFLMTPIDRLLMIRGCPGLSRRNVVERAMSLLNIGLSGLALNIERINLPRIFIKMLEKCNSMKKVRDELAIYESEHKLAIELMECQLKNNSNNTSNSTNKRKVPDNEESECSSCDKFSEGYKFIKFFEGWGYYVGSVVKSISKERRCVHFIEDDEEIEMTVDQINEDVLYYKNTKVGDVGYRLCTSFELMGGESKVYTGKVIEDLKNGKFKCEYSDGESKSFNQSVIVKTATHVFKYTNDGILKSKLYRNNVELSDDGYLLLPPQQTSENNDIYSDEEGSQYSSSDEEDVDSMGSEIYKNFLSDIKNYNSMAHDTAKWKYGKEFL